MIKNVLKVNVRLVIILKKFFYETDFVYCAVRTKFLIETRLIFFPENGRHSPLFLLKRMTKFTNTPSVTMGTYSNLRTFCHDV